MRLRRQREQSSAGVEAQAGAVPKTISDPKQRADLDALRRKFLEGLQVFKSRGKDIYKLPWFVIIGESGSGKTMAIRNSGIDFPRACRMNFRDRAEQSIWTGGLRIGVSLLTLRAR